MADFLPPGHGWFVGEKEKGLKGKYYRKNKIQSFQLT